MNDTRPNWLSQHWSFYHNKKKSTVISDMRLIMCKTHRNPSKLNLNENVKKGFGTKIQLKIGPFSSEAGKQWQITDLLPEFVQCLHLFLSLRLVLGELVETNTMLPHLCEPKTGLHWHHNDTACSIPKPIQSIPPRNDHINPSGLPGYLPTEHQRVYPCFLNAKLTIFVAITQRLKTMSLLRSIAAL